MFHLIFKTATHHQSMPLRGGFLGFIRFCLLAVFMVAAMPSHAAQDIATVRLYALDCGHFEFKDMAVLSDTGEYDGKPGKFANPCFLIRHPKGVLLWDAGLGDKIADSPGGIELGGGSHVAVPQTLGNQLKALSLTPADVSHVAFSHFHFDHTGNANAFGSSTWILNNAELNWALAHQTPLVNRDSFSAYKTAKTQMIDADHDVFGDGSVRILAAPGHTPGSQVLAIVLKHSGTVILSGDLYHARASRKHHLVPTVNVERADTLASMDRIERIVKNTKARLVIQHDPDDFKSLPQFPAFLD